MSSAHHNNYLPRFDSNNNSARFSHVCIDNVVELLLNITLEYEVHQSSALLILSVVGE